MIFTRIIVNKPLFFYGLSFALLGFCIGIFSGLSHSPVIGVLLPLLFGLIGGANGLYLARADLTKENDRRRLGLLGLMLSFFLTFVLIGSLYGILVRTGSGLSSLLLHLQPVSDSTTHVVALANIDTLDTGTALELALLRYRLSRLGVGVEEQKTILAMARKAIERPIDRKQMAAAFGNLLTLANQIQTLLSEKNLLGNDRPFEVGEVREITNFLVTIQSKYKYLEKQLPQHDVPISYLVDLLEKHREIFSSLIRYRYQRQSQLRFTQWLLDNPSIRNKLWELELAYIDTGYMMRDMGWLSGQPLAKEIDKLIQSSGSSTSSKAEEDVISEVERRTGFAP